MDLTGKIKLGGVETEFLLTDDGSFMQWGGTREQLGPRVDLLEALGSAYLEWRQESLCRVCEEATLDDGEGQDGMCGNCADRSSCPADCSPDNEDLMDGPCSECGTDWRLYDGGDYDEFRREQRDAREEEPPVDPCQGRGGTNDPRCGRPLGHDGPCDWIV
jgi:hypothetical protein